MVKSYSEKACLSQYGKNGFNGLDSRLIEKNKNFNKKIGLRNFRDLRIQDKKTVKKKTILFENL